MARVRKLSRRYEWALDLRLSLLILATLAYVAERSSTSILVAGFATGLVVAAVGEPRRLTRQVRGIAHGFFIPLFFVTLGARLDVRGLDVALAVVLVVAATAIHLVVAPVPARSRSPPGWRPRRRSACRPRWSSSGSRTGASTPARAPPS